MVLRRICGRGAQSLHLRPLPERRQIETNHRQALEQIRLLQQRLGITAIYVTHDQEEAMTMAQRIAIMHLGWIAQIGSPIDIYETPVSRLVCEFIGNASDFQPIEFEVKGRTTKTRNLPTEALVR